MPDPQAQQSGQGGGHEQGGEGGGHGDHAGHQGMVMPFSSLVNGHFDLFVFDHDATESYAIPAAGHDVFDAMPFAGGRVIFMRDDPDQSRIFFYDPVGEILGTFNDVNESGPVDHPMIADDGTALSYVQGSPRGGLARLWINGVVTDPAKVNAVGAADGGIDMFHINCDARWAAVVSGNGHLYLYDVVNPAIHEVVAAEQVGDRAEPVMHASLSPDASQVAFEKGGRVFRYDRTSDTVDPMPFLNRAFNADMVMAPMWMCGDNAHLYVMAMLDRRTGETRVLEYNWITETVAALSLLNNVVGHGIQAISDVP